MSVNYGCWICDPTLRVYLQLSLQRTHKFEILHTFSMMAASMAVITLRACNAGCLHSYESKLIDICLSDEDIGKGGVSTYDKERVP